MSKPVRPAPHIVDVAVGVNIRQRRRAMKISQEALAQAIDVTFQQVQKYERGANRVSASMLYEICRTLQCHPSELMPAPDWYFGDVAPRWLADARVLHALHPHLFATLLALPEDNLRLLITGLQALTATPPAKTAARGHEMVA